MKRTSIITCERELQSACNRILDKIPNLKYLHIEKGRGQNKTHRKDVPDLIIWYGSNNYFIEFKFGDNKLSPGQIEFRDWAIKNQFPHNVIYTVDDFMSFLRDYRIVK